MTAAAHARLRFLVATLLLCLPLYGQHQHPAPPPAQTSDQPGDAGLENSAATMSSRHLDMGAHMHLTALRALQTGDQQRADAVLAGARKAAEYYKDYKTAEADGFRIFLPNLPQKMYHFTNYEYGYEAIFRLNPEHPTSLLYEKLPDGGYKLIGVMYTAPYSTAPEELDARLPFSIAQWHLHTNFCKAPQGHEAEYFGAKAKYGLLGSISTRAQCDAAGGSFLPHVFGWMVHVYPLEKDPAQIWSVERGMDHGGHSH